MSSVKQLERVDGYRSRIVNAWNIPAVLFAGEGVRVETAAVTELISMLDVQGTANGFYEADPESFASHPEVTQVAVTPDFHKGQGIPIGTVIATKGFAIPQAIGNDVNCGMRLHVTTLRSDQVREVLDEIEKACRQVFFQGGRDIPMTRAHREAMFLNGISGLLDSVSHDHNEGLWSIFHELDLANDLSRIERRGSLRAHGVFGLSDFMGPADRVSRDNQIGSIGGGNHFVELQEVIRVLDGPTAHAWGLEVGAVTVMVHTGSLSIGQVSGSYYRDAVKQVFPRALKHPQNGIFILPLGERHEKVVEHFNDTLSNAANFAFVNRMFLAIMMLSCVRRVLGDVGMSLVYDAPHNLTWSEEMDGEAVVVHRKGACPSRGYEAMQGTPFAYYGEPVLVPGSMGSSSFVLAGQGNSEALWSASHGAGRALSRGDALKGHEEECRRFMDDFRVVTPVDLKGFDIRKRPDILEKKLSDLKQEAPYAYKGIGPVIQTLAGAGIARPVAELAPIMTVKG